MGYTKMPTLISCITFFCHFGWCSLFAESMGIKGIALATLITYSSNFLGAVLYAHVYIWMYEEKKLEKAWFWPDSNTFRDLKSYIFLAVNCSVLMVLQWWAFEVIAITSIYFGVI